MKPVNMLPYTAKNFADVIKLGIFFLSWDLEMEKLSWIIWVGPNTRILIRRKWESQSGKKSHVITEREMERLQKEHSLLTL